MADRKAYAMMRGCRWHGASRGRALLSGLLALMCLAGAFGPAQATAKTDPGMLDAPLVDSTITVTDASIEGTVTDADDSPITDQEICVVAEPVDGGSYGYATTDSTGGYAIANLSAGSYDVYASDCYGSSRNDIPGYYELDGSMGVVELPSGQS